MAKLLPLLEKLPRGTLWRAFNELSLRWKGKAQLLSGPDMEGMMARSCWNSRSGHGTLISGKTDEQRLAKAILIELRSLCWQREHINDRISSAVKTLGLSVETEESSSPETAASDSPCTAGPAAAPPADSAPRDGLHSDALENDRA